MKKLLYITTLFSLLMTGCQKETQTHYILYVEQEAGIEPFQTRILVNEEFIRFDDGNGTNDFVLLNRDEQRIYSVNHGMRSVMILEPKKFEAESPFELIHSVKVMGDMKEAPEINGIKPVHYQFSTNKQVCVDVITVDGLMPEAVEAYREFQMILASDSANTINNLPADLQEPCTIALSTFAPVRHLQYGFPVQEWKPGYSRSLMDYKIDFEPAPDAFLVPDDYFMYTVQQFREGRVDLEERKVISE